MVLDSDPTGRSAWNELWLYVSEGYIGGVHHALNNRVAAVSAVVQVMGSGFSGGDELRQALYHEVVRLQKTVGHMGFLRPSRASAKEPIDLPSLLKEVLPICEEHSDLRELSYNIERVAAVSPVYAEPSLLTRVILTQVALAGLAPSDSSSPMVEIRCEGDDVWVTLGVRSLSAPTMDGDAARVSQSPAASGLAWVARAMGGHLIGAETVTPEGRSAIRLPTLMEVRRREREG